MFYLARLDEEDGSTVADESAVVHSANSDAALAEMLRKHVIRAFKTAGVYAFRGQSDEAFKWLDLAYAQKDPYLYSIKGEPTLKKLEADPRYDRFLKKMNLPK